MMTTENTTGTDKALKAAEQAVAAFEKIAPSEPWAESAREAEASVSELRGRAAAELFPSDVAPVGADLAADLKLYTEGMAGPGYGQALAQLHGSCLEKHAKLASLLRAPMVLARVSEQGSGQAVVLQRRAEDMAAEAVAAYQRAVAAQLHDRTELEPWSRILAEDLPAFDARIAATRERHEDHARSKSERQQRELVVRRAELVERLRGFPRDGYFFKVPGHSEKISAPRLVPMVEEGQCDAGLLEIEHQVTNCEHFRGQVPA